MIALRKWWIALGAVVMLYGVILIASLNVMPEEESAALFDGLIRHLDDIAHGPSMLKWSMMPFAWASLVMGALVARAGVVRQLRHQGLSKEPRRSIQGRTRAESPKWSESLQGFEPSLHKQWAQIPSRHCVMGSSACQAEPNCRAPGKGVEPLSPTRGHQLPVGTPLQAGASGRPQP